MTLLNFRIYAMKSFLKMVFRLIRGDNTFKLFIKAMISTAEVYIATEDNSQIIGFISLATLDEILKEYRKNLSKSDFMVILANVIKPGNFRLIFSSFLYQILDRNGIYRLEINWIGVDKKFQGQGVGSKLIKIALKEKHCFQNIYVKTLKRAFKILNFTNKMALLYLSVYVVESL